MNICIAGAHGHGGTIWHAIGDHRVRGVCGDNIHTPGMNPVKYDDYETMLDDAKPDIIVVDGEYGDHARMSIAAMKRGIAVFCDKPAATTLNDLNALKATDGRLWSMLTTRYEPQFYTMKKMIERGAIGDIRLMSGQKSYRLGERAEFYRRRGAFGGLIPWVMMHSVDTMLWLSGATYETGYAFHSRGDMGDLELTATANMRLSGDILCALTADYLRPAAAPTHGDDRLRVVGTSGILEVAFDKLYIIDDDGAREVELINTPDLFADFLRCLSGGEPEYPGMDAIYATEVCLKLRDSADAHL